MVVPVRGSNAAQVAAVELPRRLRILDAVATITTASQVVARAIEAGDRPTSGVLSDVFGVVNASGRVRILGTPRRAEDRTFDPRIAYGAMARDPASISAGVGAIPWISRKGPCARVTVEATAEVRKQVVRGS